MAKIFEATPERLRYLLESIHNKEVALPDFQRDFVWDPRATDELIESICQSFPAGSLLRIKNQSGFFFAPREFSGAPSLNGHAPSYLVLDGQQRLTSLYQAFYGAGTHQFLINLGGLIQGGDLEDCVFYLRNRDAEKQYGTLEQQATTLTFPLKFLFGDPGGFEEWLDKVLEIRSESETEKKTLKQSLREVQKTWLRPVDEYDFPMVTLADGTGAEAVCTIFETLNRTGVKLSVFDLLAARFWPEEVRLRDHWEKSQEKHSIIADFQVDPYYMLQSIALYTAATASCKRSDVLKMNVAQIRSGWQPVAEGLADALHLLHDDCGVVISQWLPYTTILVPAAAIMAYAGGAKGLDVGSARAKVRQWFWCSVFSQAYEKSPNSQASKDFTELKRWIDGGSAPATIADFTFEADGLRQITPRQRAAYRGVMALILRNEARDFHSGKRITAQMIRDERIDDHHVFPFAYLGGLQVDIKQSSRDCVLNRTLIDQQTNLRIGKRAPSDYLSEIRAKLGDGELSELLDSHLLPYGADSALLRDDFEAFLAQRQALIKEHIKEVTT